MATDLHEVLDRGAAPPRHALDVALTWERARQLQRRRRALRGAGIGATVLAVVALAIALAPGNASDTSVRVPPAVSSPAVVAECTAAHQPLTADPDTLPHKGSTDEAAVRQVLTANVARLEHTYPGVALRVEPRDGDVWSYGATGAVLTESVHDFWIVAELATAADCPPGPEFWSGVPLRFVAPGAGPAAFDKRGDTVELPAAWFRADSPLAPELADPHEILAMATFALHADTHEAVCVGNSPPSNALAQMGADDSFVWVAEWDTSGLFHYGNSEQPTPATVAARPPHFAADQFSPRDCVARGFPGLTARELLFTDQGRVFDLHVVAGDNVSRATEQQLYAMLDTLRFTSR